MPHILIIEDDPLFRQLFEETFRLIDVEISSAASGKEGIDLLESERPDLVVLDLQLPHVSGFDVIRYIRNNPEYKNTKIVAVTGDFYATKSPEASLVDLFELKPVNIQSLLEKVKTLL